MMNNLFSVFDPSSYFSISFNWLSTMIFMIIITPIYWNQPTKFNLLINKLVNIIHTEFKMLLGPSSFKGSTILFVSLLIMLMMNNFMGLFPYIYTASSHMTMTMAMSMPLWIAFMLFGWINYTKHMFSHLVPQSTPCPLMPFMVLIESISNIIRPLTLAVRLMANMVAGHLLMTLLGNQTAMASNLILLTLISTQIMLLILESAVALIQAYVFAVLSTLYASEITTH